MNINVILTVTIQLLLFANPNLTYMCELSLIVFALCTRSQLCIYVQRVHA